MSREIRIQSLNVRQGAVDEFVAVARGEPTFGDPNAPGYVLLDWQGYVAFYDNALDQGTDLGPDTPVMRLPARWVDRRRPTRVSPQQQYIFTFAATVTPEGLHRIEEYRACRPLFARVEGEVTFFLDRVIKTQEGSRLALAEQFSSRNYSMRERFVTHTLEVSPHKWIHDVLNVLRPPGKVIMEATLPTPEQESELARRALAELAEAQDALDLGREDEVARLVYLALEHYKPAKAHLVERYGERLGGLLHGHAGNARGVANEARHARERKHLDRPLARHLLVVAKSLVALYSRAEVCRAVDDRPEDGEG